MALMVTNRSKKKKPDDSPDEILNKAMDLCGKCSKKWPLGCEDISKDQ